jgi:hypothetical protein
MADALLPRNWIRGVRRIRRTLAEIVALAREAGMVLERSTGEGSAETMLLFVRGER